MILLALLELSAGAIVFLALITQVVIPAFRGTPLFPFLRTERHLAADLERAEEAVLEEALRVKIERRLQEAEHLRQKRADADSGPAEVPPAGNR